MNNFDNTSSSQSNLKFCVFCYRKLLKDFKDKDFQELYKFFVFSGRYVGTDIAVDLGKNIRNEVTIPSLISICRSLTLVCHDCLSVIKSFNHVYHEWKRLELQVNWRMESLVQLIKFSDRVPSRFKSFREGTTVEHFDRIVKFRRKFVKQSFQRTIKYCPPKVKLDRLRSTPSSVILIPSPCDVDQRTNVADNNEISEMTKMKLASEISTGYSNESLKTISTPTQTPKEEEIFEDENFDVETEVSFHLGDAEAENIAEQILLNRMSEELNVPQMESASENTSGLILNEPAEIAGMSTLSPTSSPPEIVSSHQSSQIGLEDNNADYDSNIEDVDIMMDVGEVKLEKIISNTPCKNPVPLELQEDKAAQNKTEINGSSELNESIALCEKFPANESMIDVGSDTLPMRRLRRIHQCTVCKQTFSNEDRLRIHVESRHADDDDEDEKDISDDEDHEIDNDNDDSSELSESSLDSDDDEYDDHELPKGTLQKLMEDGHQESGNDSNEHDPLSSHEENESEENNGDGDVLEKKPIISSTVIKKEFQFKCKLCPKTFTRLHYLNHHISAAHNPNNKLAKGGSRACQRLTANGITMTFKDWAEKKGAKFKCKLADCKAIFMTDFELEKHSKLHGEFYCDNCSEMKTFAPDLAAHELTHNPENTKNSKSKLGIFNCTRCPYKAKFRGSYIFHFLKKHLGGLEMDLHRCPICKYLFTQTYDVPIKYVDMLFKHYVSHHDLFGRDTEKDVHKCHKCQAYFLSHLQLDAHLARIHSEGDKKFTCHDCGAAFRERRFLKGHRAGVHKKFGDELKFICDGDIDCAKRFETQVDLDRHKMLRHSGKDPILMCSKCGKKVLGKSALRVHMISHDEKLKVPKKPTHVCEECGKAFDQYNNLVRHKITHIGHDAWKFSCSVCNRKMSTKQNLELHMRTHTKEKPFVCDVCGEKYGHRHNWKNHMKTKHGIDETVRKVENTANLASTRKGKKRKLAGDND